MDLLGVGDDPRFATFDGRVEHRAELDAIVADWVGARTVGRGARARSRPPEAAIAPVYSMADLAGRPAHRRARRDRRGRRGPHARARRPHVRGPRARSATRAGRSAPTPTRRRGAVGRPLSGRAGPARTRDAPRSVGVETAPSRARAPTAPRDVAAGILHHAPRVFQRPAVDNGVDDPSDLGRSPRNVRPVWSCRQRMPGCRPEVVVAPCCGRAGTTTSPLRVGCATNATTDRRRPREPITNESCRDRPRRPCRRFVETVRSTARRGRAALEGRRRRGASGPGPSTPTGPPGSPARLRGARRRPRRPGRAHDAQPARVPRRRHRGAAASARRRSRSTTRRRRSRSQYLVGHCEASVAIVEDDELPRPVPRGARRAARSCAHVVVDRGAAPAAADGVLAWDDLLAADPVDLDDGRRRSRSPSDLATVIYTSGTTGPPKGVMLDHANICGRSSAYRAALGDRDADGWRARVVPADGAHRRADDVALPRHRVGYEVTTCPEPRPGRQYLAEVRPADLLRGARGCGRRCTRASWRCVARRPGAQGEQFDARARRRAARSSELPGPRRGAARPTSRPRGTAVDAGARRSVRAIARARRSCIAAISGAAPIPVEILRLLPRRSACRSRRSTACSETTGPDDVGRRSASRPAPSVRAIPGIEVRLGRRRRGGLPRRQRLPRLPRRAREDGRGARRRRLAPHRRHRRVRRRRLPAHRRPQEGADHHRGRQEHLAREPRGRAQGAASSSVRRARSATAGRSSSRSSCSTPTSRPAWATQHGIERDEPRRARRPPRGASPRSTARSTAANGGFSTRSSGSRRFDVLARRVAARLRGAHADDEAQAAGHRRQVRAEIESLYS